MAEAVGLVSSAIAIIELSAKLSNTCLEYSRAVSNARANIARVQARADKLGTTFRAVRALLEGPDGQVLQTSQELIDSVHACAATLNRLQNSLDPSKSRRAMRRLGLRALKWPFSSKEIDEALSELERHEQTITLGLQVDQTTILLDIRQRVKDISIHNIQGRLTSRSPCFCLPFDRDPNFVDRPEIMTWVMNQYTGPASRLALVGLGGFGKSQLAIEAAYNIRENWTQTSVFWVHASSEGRFLEAYRSIADRLQLPRRDDPDTNIPGLVRDWLQRDDTGPWLLILDNADDINLLYNTTQASKSDHGEQTQREPNSSRVVLPLASFLPKRHGGKILVTSRNLDVAERLTGSQKAVFRVGSMDGKESLELFRHKLKGDFDQDVSADLLHALDNIPLAITQAAAYINRRAPRISVTTYLDDLRKSDKKKGSLLHKDLGDLRRDETVANSVVATWQVTFDQIRHEKPSAADLLSFMSLFNPQDIPEFALREYQDKKPNQGGDNENEFEDDLDVLRGYSLVSMTVNRGLFEMHPLVQFCTRVWLSSAGDIERWKKAFLLAMSEHFPFGDYDNWPICRTLHPHVESIVQEEPPVEAQLQWADLLVNCAAYKFTTGDYGAAVRLHRKALEKKVAILGEEHLLTLTIKRNLAMVCAVQGMLKEAGELYTQIMDVEERSMGEDHPNRLSTMSSLALLYCQQGKFKEAEGLLVHVLGQKKRTLGEQHPETLTCMNNLAATYSQLGLNDKAEELIVQVLETRKRIQGEHDPRTLGGMHNLARTWRDQGRVEDALALMQSCAVGREKVLGPNHPDTLNSLATLSRWREEMDSESAVRDGGSRTSEKEQPALRGDAH